MNIGMMITIGFGVIVALMVLAVVLKKRPKKLKVIKFQDEWKRLQAYCKDKKTWGLAVTEADKLLDKALTRRKFSGKSMGERMVSAQRTFTDNDGVWFAHNLSKKILEQPALRLKEEDVKDALVCMRQALRDIGALSNEKS